MYNYGKTAININFNKHRFVDSKKKLYVILGVLTVIILLFASYFSLTPINYQSGALRFLLILLCLIWSVPLWVRYNNPTKNKPFKKNPFFIFLAAAIFLFALNIILGISSSPLFIASNYRNLISVKDNNTFETSVEDYTTMQIPVVDKDLAAKLGDKKLGEDNLGSQFNVGSYTMINYKSNLYWVAPIEFNGFFPWVNRRVSPGYVLINANDQSDVQIIKTELQYTESSYFWNDLQRENYYSNVKFMREEAPHLEIDDDGNPMYIESVYVHRFGLVNGLDVEGVIITDPVNGKAQYYKTANVPSWVDHIQSEEVVLDQLNYWGKYVNGFFNSLFAKKDMLEVSTGVNYVYSNGQMYLQTGMTSVGSDESIVGVMMVDMRSKQALFSRIGGATEYAGAQSAIGAEQSMKFSASDPIMINVSGIPTYFLLLKDNEGLVKRYAYVNVKDYTLVVTNVDKTAALADYKARVLGTHDTNGTEYTISAIEKVIFGGETYFYIKFEQNADSVEGFAAEVFKAPVTLSDELPFVKAGDKVKIIYNSDNVITSLVVEK